MIPKGSKTLFHFKPHSSNSIGASHFSACSAKYIVPEALLLTSHKAFL
jgi:hypothetical protein